jgi:hypothetical protein
VCILFAINVWINGTVPQPNESGINRNIEIRIDVSPLEPSIPDMAINIRWELGRNGWEGN